VLGPLKNPVISSAAEVRHAKRVSMHFQVSLNDFSLKSVISLRLQV